MLTFMYSFETRPGPGGRPWTRPTQDGNGAGLKKK